jgi:hypothetical protein
MWSSNSIVAMYFWSAILARAYGTRINVHASPCSVDENKLDFAFRREGRRKNFDLGWSGSRSVKAALGDAGGVGGNLGTIS